MSNFNNYSGAPGLTKSPGMSNLNNFSGAPKQQNSNASQNTPSGFGNNNPGGVAGSGFGNKNGGFGGFSGFGSFNTQQKAAEKPVDPLIQRLNRIKDAYEPPSTSQMGFTQSNAQKGTSYRFSAIVNNISGSAAGNAPGGITQENWLKEVAKAKQYPMVNINANNTTDSMVPFLLCGFQKLNERKESQKKFVENMQRKLQSLKLDIDTIRDKYDKIFIHLIEEIAQRNQEISERLMTVLQKKEIESFPDLPFSPEEHELSDRLQKLENEMSRPNKFKSALNALDLKATMIRESGPIDQKVQIPDQTNEAEAIIKSNHDAIVSLIKIIAESQKKTEVLENTFQDKTLYLH